MPWVWSFETCFLLPNQEWEAERRKKGHYNPRWVSPRLWEQIKDYPGFVSDEEYLSFTE